MGDERMKTFLGYRNSDGTFGTRSFVGIVAATSAANPVVRDLNKLFNQTVPIYNSGGRAQYSLDMELNERLIVNIATNPNLDSVLIVGYDEGRTKKIYNMIKRDNKKEMITIQGRDTIRTISDAQHLLLDMVKNSTARYRVNAPIDQLTIAMKCGSSDTTSGLFSNPVAGRIADKVVSLGGSVIFGETIEVIGAEENLYKRADNEEIVTKISKIINTIDQEALRSGINNYLTSSDNIKGGLTTIEEKSLGAIKKSGSEKIVDAIGPGSKIAKRGGVTFMNSPSAAPEFMSCISASGSNVCLFTTGGGNPAGNPVLPVIKMTANPETSKNMKAHIDIDISDFMENMDFEKATDLVFEELLRVVGGKRTSSEVLSQDYIAFPRWGLWPMIGGRDVWM
jgi:altronate dehydratase